MVVIHIVVVVVHILELALVEVLDKVEQLELQLGTVVAQEVLLPLDMVCLLQLDKVAVLVLVLLWC